MLEKIIFVIAYGLLWGAWRWWDGRGYGPGWFRTFISVILTFPMAVLALGLFDQPWIGWPFFALVMIGMPVQWVLGYKDIRFLDDDEALDPIGGDYRLRLLPVWSDNDCRPVCHRLGLPVAELGSFRRLGK